MGYEKIEQETHITMDEDTLKWNIYTRQRRIMTKLNKITKPYKVETEGDVIIGAYYKLDLKQISFKKLRVLTEEEKAIIRERFKSNSDAELALLQGELEDED